MASWLSRITPGSQPQARPADEELDPKSEWKDDPAAHVLSIYLPGFEKDRIKVKLDKVTKTVNVSAERPRRSNKIVRVNKDYRIPGNSDPEKMRGKLENQTLTITIPKEIASPVDSKPRNEKSPTTPIAPSPPLAKQKLEEKLDRIPSLLPDPWREMGEGRDFPDPSVLKGKNKAKFLEDEDETETETPPPSSTQRPHSEKIPTVAAALPPSPEKQQLEEKPAVFSFLLPDPWREMAEGRDFPDPSVLKKRAKAVFIKDEDENKPQTSPGIFTSLADTKMSTENKRSDKPDNEVIAKKWKESARAKIWDVNERKESIPGKKISWKGKGAEERKEYHSEQEMKMSNDIPGSEEPEMKVKEETREEEIDTYAAARKAMLDLTLRIREDRQLAINVGVAALMVVALGTYISYTVGLSREDDN